MSTESIVKIMIVEDQPIVIHGLCQFLDIVPAFKVVATAKNTDEARRHVQNLGIDLVIMDIRLQSDIDGIDLTAEFRTQFENLIVLIYSDEKYVEFVRRALRAGARGYLLKGSGIEKIKSAIDTVMDGSIYLDGGLPVRPDPEVDPLTAREEEILRLVAKWKTTKQIAYELKLADATVKSHKQNIMAKLYLSGLNELEREAIRRYGNPDDRGTG